MIQNFCIANRRLLTQTLVVAAASSVCSAALAQGSANNMTGSFGQIQGAGGGSMQSKVNGNMPGLAKGARFANRVQSIRPSLPGQYSGTSSYTGELAGTSNGVRGIEATGSMSGAAIGTGATMPIENGVAGGMGGVNMGLAPGMGGGVSGQAWGTSFDVWGSTNLWGKTGRQWGNWANVTSSAPSASSRPRSASSAARESRVVRTYGTGRVAGRSQAM